ncbi:MAG TPA: carboxypeptidase-like regulatory domain-containing protein [Candidatus Thermoplasmatota archaeon]|nr:carboxypeptidase-like regulatory domain-containing protein [Candidatus Thermoplasmatota archaeon]
MDQPWVAVAVLVVLLAGCANPDKTASAGDSAAAPTSGTLAGVVVDAAIRPLAGASLVLIPGDLNATADATGAFSFADLRFGDYTLTASLAGYLDSTTTVTVAEGDAGAVQVVLEVEPSDTRFANLYKYDGLYECGFWPTNGCANVNIVTGIMLCETPAPCFNATSDSSIFLQWVDPGMQFLQTEMSWEPTFDFGKELYFGVGGANRDELQRGIAPGYNDTGGQSPLMVTLDWETLNESKIGTERSLLLQISSGAADTVPGGCVFWDPCGPTVHFQQPFQVFTTTFYGYLPPPGWLFAETGMVPPPPPK